MLGLKKRTAAQPAANQPPAGQNGVVPVPSPTPASKQAAPPKKDTPASRDLRQVRLAQSFAQIVAVLMRDPGYANLKVTDLEWLVVPPIMAGQYRLAHVSRPAQTGKVGEGGILVPVAAALWARVSPQVDKSLWEALDKPVRLSPAAWTSGDIPWLMVVAGDRRATPAFLKRLQESEFKGKQVKMRVRSPDGKLVVGDLAQSAGAN